MDYPQSELEGSELEGQHNTENSYMDVPMHPLYIDAERLENEICTLAANINAASYQLLMLIAEYDEKELWAKGGNRSCAHWLNWKCGIGISAGREKVRVAHALKKLPLVSKAFEEGKLSYSKARAITRVGTNDNESYLLVIAKYGSASHLDRLVNQFRRVKRVHQRAEERREAAELCDQRKLTHTWDDDGMLLIKVRLPAEQGAVVLKSLDIALEALNKDRQLPQPHQNCDNLDEDVAQEDYYHPSVGDGLQKALTNRRADALVIMAESHLQNATIHSNTADRYQVTVVVDKDILSETAPDASALCNDDNPGRENPNCHLEEGAALSVETVRRLCCDASIIPMVEKEGEILSVGRKTRAIPPSLNRALRKRDCGCRFPGCDATRFLEGHHVIHWADGGETSLDNLIQLCKHHHRLMHEGGFNVVNSNGKFNFYTPSGAYIPPAAPWMSSGDILSTVNADLRNEIDENTVWQWHGDHMDYHIAVENLCQKDEYLRDYYDNIPPYSPTQANEKPSAEGRDN